MNTESLKNWIKSRGIAAPIIFICVQILQVVVFIIPGEFPQVAGGYLFGTAFGTLYSIIGIMIGSAINFYLSKFLGIPFVKALFKEEKFERIQSLATSKRAQIILFILFLIPGLPKDFFTYIAGLSPIGFLSFLVISGSGRLPGIVGSTLIGDAASQKNWPLVISVSVIAVVLFFTGYFLREKIYRTVMLHFHKEEGAAKE
ncbi:MAG: TVP38/TMEM64 family protein [Spirochaetales bacterium]|nr:TVP38/TMEM64 family protein [Spirochaetales bacterium]